MDQTTQISAEVAKLIATVGFLWWFVRKISAKQDCIEKKVGEHATRLAIAEEKAKNISEDHDKLSLTTYKVDELGRDLNAAHFKIRELEKE